jgi:hypothetical protein
MSLTVDISMAQIALITAGTSGVLRRVSEGEAPLSELADRVDRFVGAPADSMEARACAADLVDAWRVFLASPRARQFLFAHDERRGIAKQEQAVRRMHRLEMALRQPEGDGKPTGRKAHPAA